MSTNSNVNLEKKKEVFLENNIKVKEPITLFREWLNLALNTEEILEANAGCLATVNKDGQPSNRFVLLKDVTDEGFTFFTSYGTRKANDIAENPNVALTFYWGPLKRSVRIEGVAENISTPTQKPSEPRPNSGGYLIRPRLIEFWQGQTDRFPDRIRFRYGAEEEVDGILVHLGELGWVYEHLDHKSKVMPEKL